MTGVDVLICAEDPGACNFLAPLPERLRADGLSSAVVAHPRVAAYLQSRGATFTTPDPSIDAEAVLLRYTPGALVSGTSEFADCLGLRLISVARRRGVPSIAVVDMAANASRRFRGQSDDPLRHAPDRLAVCDQGTADAFAALGFLPARISLCGHPHFDVIRARRAVLEGEDRAALRRTLFTGAGDRKVIVFVAESVDQLDPSFSRRSAAYSLAGRGNAEFRTAIILEELLDAALLLPERPYVVVRLHPKNSEGEFEAFRDEIDQMSADGDPVPLIWAADAVVGMTSMLLVEAYLLGRPTLSVLPRREEAALIVTTASGLTQVATTRAEVRAGLVSLLERPAAPVVRAAADGLPVGALDRLMDLVTPFFEMPRVSAVGR
jgi:hypothetical protein